MSQEKKDDSEVLDELFGASDEENETFANHDEIEKKYDEIESEATIESEIEDSQNNKMIKTSIEEEENDDLNENDGKTKQANKQ